MQRQSSCVKGQSYSTTTTIFSPHFSLCPGPQWQRLTCLWGNQQQQRPACQITIPTKLITGNCPLPFTCLTQIAHWLNRFLPETLSFHSSEGHVLRGRERKTRVKRALHSVPGESFCGRNLSAPLPARKERAWDGEGAYPHCVSVFVLNICSQDHLKMCIEKKYGIKKKSYRANSVAARCVWLSSSGPWSKSIR